MSKESTEILKLIKAWMRASDDNTPIKLSQALGYKSNIVQVWIKKNKVSFAKRVKPFVQMTIDGMKENELSQKRD